MPEVILVRGKAGVGKTTLTSEISKILKIPVIQKDDLYDAIASEVKEHDTRNQICETIIYNLLETNLSLGINVIIDNSWHYKSQVISFREWVLKKNVKFQSILCICSDEKIWAQRFNQRKLNPRPNNLITDFNELKNHYKDLRTEPIDGEIVLDTINPINVLIKCAIRELKIKGVDGDGHCN